MSVVNTAEGADLRASGDGRFVLDRAASFQIDPEIASEGRPRWMQPTHLGQPRDALVLIAGERLRTGCLRVFADSRLFLRFGTGLPEISPDGLACVLRFESSDGSGSLPIGEFALAGAGATDQWRTVEMDLSWLSGAVGWLSVQCAPGPDHDPRADWLALSDLYMAREGQFRLSHAQSHRAVRTKNEAEHFSRLYGDAAEEAGQAEQPHPAMERWTPDSMAGASIDVPARWTVDEGRAPLPGESAYDYALNLYRQATGTGYPDYPQLLREMVRARGRIKVLSICCGAARVEAQLAAEVPQGIAWTFLDINEDLLRQVGRKFSSTPGVRLILADANELVFRGERWDLILCVSGLHHLVELEKVLGFISNSLMDDGEFWSIGEAVGRNGNRLWPEARDAADAIFAGLAPRLRLNAYTGQVDERLPDFDYSVGSYEGIRSEDILPLLHRWFDPLDVQVWNCALWRLLDGAYVNNYDLDRDDDREAVVAMVRAEIELFGSGGRGTGFFGFFRRKDMRRR